MTSRERFYDTIAGDLDAWMNPYDLRRRVEVVFEDLLGDTPLDGARILDVGCGTGPFTLAAQQRGAHVTSLDIGQALLRRARAKGARHVVAGDAGALPFPDGAFDVVMSSECIEHTARPQTCVAEMLRVLRAGGLLALTCPNRTWHWSVVVATALRLRPYRGFEHWPGWFALRRWVRSHGGQVTRHAGVHLFPFVWTPTHPLLRHCDRYGASLGPLYVNQALRAVKLERPAAP